VLTIGPDGRPQQTPIAQLQQLRTEHFNRSGFTLENASYTLPQPVSNTVELGLLIQPGDGTLVLRMPGHSDDGQPATIRYDGTTLDVLGTPVALRLGEDEPLKFQLFLDRSVLELFVNGGRVAVTRLLNVTTDAPTIEIGVEAGSVTVISLDLWQLRAIW
jgi:beta-fructofuranosidase